MDSLSRRRVQRSPLRHREEWRGSSLPGAVSVLTGRRWELGVGWGAADPADPCPCKWRQACTRHRSQGGSELISDVNQVHIRHNFLNVVLFHTDSREGASRCRHTRVHIHTCTHSERTPSPHACPASSRRKKNYHLIILCCDLSVALRMRWTHTHVHTHTHTEQSSQTNDVQNAAGQEDSQTGTPPANH